MTKSLDDRIEEVQFELSSAELHITVLKSTTRDLRDENKRLCDALEWYGDTENYDLRTIMKDNAQAGGREWWICPIDDDKGKIARKALGDGDG